MKTNVRPRVFRPGHVRRAWIGNESVDLGDFVILDGVRWLFEPEHSRASARGVIVAHGIGEVELARALACYPLRGDEVAARYDVKTKTFSVEALDARVYCLPDGRCLVQNP